MKSRTIASLCAAGILLSGTAVVVAAPAASASAVAAWPGPLCPEKAPEGWEFVKTVYLYGIPYDLYRKLDDDGTYSYRQVYCRG
jgi:hypothetical protein